MNWDLLSSNHLCVLKEVGIKVSDIGSILDEFKELLELELEVLVLDELSLSVNRESVVAVLSPEDFRLNSLITSLLLKPWCIDILLFSKSL